MLPFFKTDSRATVPTKGSKGAAGYDLFPLEDITIPPHTTNMAVPTGIAVDLSKASTSLIGNMNGIGIYGRVASRSGLAYRHGVNVLAGVIDQDYRDQIHVIITNPGDTEIHIPRNKAIAQLILELYATSVELNEVSSLDELTHTERGTGKFGSTDKK